MSDWVRRTFTSSPKQLQITENTGRTQGLYTVVRTQYEQNSKTGEVRKVQTNGVNTVTVFTEIPIGAKGPTGDDLWESLRGTEYAYQDASAKRYVAQIGLRTFEPSNAPGTVENRYYRTGWAGAAVINNLANWKNGKTADFTDNAFAIANQGALEQAASRAGLPPSASSRVPGNLGIARSQNNATLKQTDDSGSSGDSAPPPAAGNDEPSPRFSGVNLDIGTADNVTNFPTGKDGNTLRYPKSIIENSTDYLLISIAEYKKIGPDLIRGTNDGSIRSKEGQKSSIGNIILPIPSNIQDGNSVSYADGTLDGITAGVVKGANNIMTENPTNKTANELKDDYKKTIGTAFKDVADAGLQGQILRSLAVQAASLIPGVGAITPEQLLTRQTGGILNPNMELLFNGVSLRSFKFSFKMTPRNKDEADEIKEIIRYLKINMAPQTLTNDSFLRTPNVFDLQYMKGTSPHPFLHRFKTCALTDMSVNYTGEGLYASYNDATPVSMVMDLTFKELEPIYNTDYESVGGVGY